MRAAVLVVGQGLAGTLLGWELERAGISFAIVDRGHAASASWAAAGIINPITGRRLVKSWRIETLLADARRSYRAIERELDVTLWREMRVYRMFADDRERTVFADKLARGELAPFAEEADDSGFWIREAAWVDLRALLTGMRQHWAQSGRLLESADPRDYDLAIDCTGVAGTARADFTFVPWEFSKGEMLELAVTGLDPDVILNRRQWVVPVDSQVAWVGATHQPGVKDSRLTPEARLALEAGARDVLGDRTFSIFGQRAGVRVNLRDKRPVAGRHPDNSHVGLINGLGAKGTLWAPMLARQWVNHLTEGVPFDPEIAVTRFVLQR